MKIIKGIFYVFIYVLAVFASSFAVFRSFGLAYGLEDNQSEPYQTSAEAMCLIEVNSGRILAGKNQDKKLPMASLTKIITAIVAIENNSDLDTKLEIPAEAQGIEGSSIYLRKGEHLTMRELLYGLMLRSGNDAATAIAILTSGSVEEFINKCNQFCKSICLSNTNLVTPSGLHDDNHYTTAEDLAKITAYALKNDIFSQIVATKFKRIDDELSKYKYRDMKNKNKFLAMMEGANGVKTGYTKKAGRCFVGSSTREEDGMQVACVLLNCKPMFEECKKLCEQAFEQYQMYKLNDGKQMKVDVAGKTVCGELSDDMYYPLTKQEFSQLSHEQTITKQALPIQKGEKIGEIQFFVDKNPILCDNIYSNENIEDNSYQKTFEKVIENYL